MIPAGCRGKCATTGTTDCVDCCYACVLAKYGGGGDCAARTLVRGCRCWPHGRNPATISVGSGLAGNRFHAVCGAAAGVGGLRVGALPGTPVCGATYVGSAVRQPGASTSWNWPGGATGRPSLPSTGIFRLGTRYLAQQAEQFKGSPWLASAAYNAGPPSRECAGRCRRATGGLSGERRAGLTRAVPLLKATPMRYMMLSAMRSRRPFDNRGCCWLKRRNIGCCKHRTDAGLHAGTPGACPADSADPR